MALLTALAAGCGGGDEPAPTTAPPAAEFPFEARFAQFEPAPEPNGDLSKVVWPDFVLPS